jgi:segregation and condensation protein B
VAPALTDRLDSIVESVLFSAGAPLPLRRLVQILDGPSAGEVKAALGRITALYAETARGIRLLAVAGGFQFRTAPENSAWVRALLRERPARLGRAAMETLAIVAYKQPTTRADVEAIRGVDADSALNTLLQKRLIKIAGRKEAAGRPLMYATTPEFLETFGLNDLAELPTLKEIGPVAEDDDDDSDESSRGTAAEDSEPGGDRLAAYGGEPHSSGAGEGERSGGEGAGNEGEPLA